MNYTPQNIVKDLANATSQTNGTSLVTIYVPDKNNLTLTISKITSELATSQNIKDKLVRSSVQSALKSGLYKVKSFANINSENGFVLCAGEINCSV